MRRQPANSTKEEGCSEEDICCLIRNVWELDEENKELRQQLRNAKGGGAHLRTELQLTARCNHKSLDVEVENWNATHGILGAPEESSNDTAVQQTRRSVREAVCVHVHSGAELERRGGLMFRLDGHL